MQVLNKNVLILKQENSYSGLIQGVKDITESTRAKVMSIGKNVDSVMLGDIVLVDWTKAKNTAGDLWLIHENDIAAIIED